MKIGVLPVIALASTMLLTSTPLSNAASKCLKVSSYLPKQILSGNESSTGKLTFVKASAIKSPDFSKVYFVAIRFKARGEGAQTGVWATNALPQRVGDNQGILMAVDGFAQQFTVWPDGDRSQAQISKADPSVLGARNCLR